METWIALAGLALTAATIIAAVTKQISGIETRASANTKALLKELKNEFEEREERARRDFAETLKSITTHISLYEKKHYELELYIRDNYIEVPTFKEALGEIKDLIKSIVTKVEGMNNDNHNWRRDSGRKSEKT